MRFVIVVFVFFVSISTFLPHTAWSQETLGFADPSDISNVLDYELPDWSYRTWDADFAFGGSGNEWRSFGSHSNKNRFSGNLGSHFFQNWESDKRNISLQGGLSGLYTRSNNRNDSRELKSHSLAMDFNIASSMIHYLAGSSFFLRLEGSAKRNYDEEVTDERIDDTWDNNKSFQRATQYDVFAGLGFGHLRNVVPLLRAQRLSERLVTMGRAALSSQQVQEIAQVLATEYGYRQVFDRADRYFWVEVLSPMLEQSNPLTAFEIFYLTDILNENIGDRFQGITIQAGFNYRESINIDFFYPETISRTPSLTIAWYHNLSLSNQIFIQGGYRYRETPNDALNSESGSFNTTIGHLWNFTDRYIWSNRLAYGKFSNIESETRSQKVRLESNLQVYLEDRVSLTTGIQLGYNNWRVGPQDSLSWQWLYSFGLKYDLDRAFF